MVASLPEGTLALVSVHSGKILEVAEGAGEGAVVVQSVDQGEDRQRWRFFFVVTDDESGDFYKLVNSRSGLVLGIENESLEDGAAALQWASFEGCEALHMQWSPVFVRDERGASYYIMNRNSKKVLDVDGGEAEESKQQGARVIQWTYGAGLNQRWRLIPSPPGSRIEPLSQPALEVPAGLMPDRSKALSLMRPIIGWFSEAEAELLLATVARALRELPGDHAIVEIGSYLGRSTVLLASTVRDLRPRGHVIAIDPHAGAVGIAGGHDGHGASTYEAFCANMAAAGLRDAVRAIRQCSTDISWDQPIGLLFVDGLHDYDSVSADFSHFERWIGLGGFVTFHDCSPHWPGVVQLVDEIRNGHDYEWVDSVDSLVVLRKKQQCLIPTGRIN